MVMVLRRRRIDVWLLAAVIALSLIGLLMVYSASNVIALAEHNDRLYYFKRQLIFNSWVSIDVLYRADEYNKVSEIRGGSVLFCLALLLIVLIPGIGIVRGGARSWIGFKGFSIQPSEFIKLGLIGIYAKYLGENHHDLKKFKNFLMLFSLAVVIFLIVMLQPDFGTGLIIIAAAAVMIYISGAPIKYFLVILGVGIGGVAFLIISAPYRVERILAFINPWQDPLGSGFQGIQSLFAITPGGLFGHGFNKSMQKHFFLPEPQNDFIFAILLEEFGLIGGAIVMALYFFVIFRSVRIALSVNDNFLMFLCAGIASALAVQVIINIAVVVGLLPVTGITLPLFSYGGSSLVLTLVSLGVVLSASKYRNYDFG